MKTFNILFIGLFLAVFPLLSLCQINTFDHRFDRGGQEEFHALDTIPTGGYILAGRMWTSSASALLMRMDEDGNVLLTKQYQGGNYTEANDVLVTPDGGFMISGTTEGLGSQGGKDAFMMKVDNLGNVVWTRSFGTTNQDVGNRMIMTRDGNYVVCGGLQGAGFLSKIDPLGNVLWSRSISISFYEGEFQDVCELEGGEGFYVFGKDCYLRTDSVGNPVFTKCNVFGITGQRILPMPDKGAILGYYLHDGVYASRVDSSGNSLWVKYFAGSLAPYFVWDNPVALHPLANGNYMLMGAEHSDMGPTGPPNHGGIDALYIEIDPANGNKINQYYLGGSGDEWIFDAIPNANCGTTIVGWYEPLNSSLRDAWIRKVRINPYSGSCGKLPAYVSNNGILVAYQETPVVSAGPAGSTGTFTITSDTLAPTTTCSTTCNLPAPVFTQTANGLTVMFDGTTGAGTTSQWDFGDGNTSTQADPTHTYATPGNYEVCLATTNSCGCIRTCQTLTANLAPPTAAFSVNTNFLTVSCFDQSMANATIMAWNWSFGDGATSTQQNPTHTYLNQGTYNICLEVVDSFGGADTSCTPVNITCPTIQAGYTYSGNFPTLSFSDQSLGAGLSHSWDFGDGGTSTLPSPNHTYANPGNYTVCLTVMDSCSADTFCDSVEVVTGLVSDFPGEISIYPNPTHGLLKLRFDLSFPEEIGLKLYDLKGKLIREKKIGLVQQNEILFDLSDITNGIYLLELSKGGRSLYQKVMVEGR